MSCPNGSPPELWAVNLDAWLLWCEVQTQWRVSFAGRVGLDYSEVRQAARYLDIDLSACMWKKIRTLERMVINNDTNHAPGA